MGDLPSGFIPDPPEGFVIDSGGGASPSPDDVPPPAEGSVEETPDAPFMERAGDAAFSRSTFAAAGGMVGSVAGSPAGPAGIIGGGALGAMAGSSVYDNVSNLVAAIQERPEDIVGGAESVRTMMGEGAMDAAFSMGGALFQPIRFGRALLGKLSGVTNEAAKDLQDTARRLGVGLGAVDIGGSLPKGYARSVGVFPFTGTPLRKGQIFKIKQSNEAVDRILNDFGPADTMNQIGVDMVSAARGARQEFKDTAAQLYKTFEDSVETAARQDIIPTQFVREDGTVGGITEVARRLSEGAQRGAVTLSDGTIMPRAGAEGVEEFVSKLQGLPGLITPAQHRQLTQDLSDLIGRNQRDGVDVRYLTQAKQALEEGFANIRTDLLPEGQGEAVKQALDAANSFYAKGIVQFQTRAAQAFERVDRAIFRAGSEQFGSLNADEVYRVAVNLRSPQQIKDLTGLVGTGTMKRAASRHFDDAVTAARTDVTVMGETFAVVDPVVLERQLGLVGAKKTQIEGLREFYKTAGVNLDDVTALVSVMKKIEGIGNASEFIRRRAVLGGASALSGALGGVGLGVVSGGVPGGAVTAVGMTLLSRHMSKIFASPEKLKLMTTALDEAADATLRRAALGKVVNAIIEEEDN